MIHLSKVILLFFAIFWVNICFSATVNPNPSFNTTNVYGKNMINSAIAATNHMKWVSLANKGNIKGVLRKHGWVLQGIIQPNQKNFYLKGTGGRAYVAYHPQKKQIVIAFRGTIAQGSAVKSFLNIRSDMNIRMKKLDWLKKDDHPDAKRIWRKLKVHAGFNNDYKNFRHSMLNLVRSIPVYHQYDIFVTGFSLGAALAMHAALDVKLSLKKQPFVYVAGSPRVGSHQFRTAYEKLIPNTLRIMLKNDIVPRVPSKKFGYTHIGRLLALNESGKRLSANTLQALKGIRGASMQEHKYDKYKQALLRHQRLANQSVHPASFFKHGLLFQLANAERK